jgi:hypothetical protein
VLDHLEACPTNDFTHVAISHTRENEHSTEGRNKISVLGTARTHGPDLIGYCGVEDGQVAGHTALYKLFEDHVSCGNSHLWAAVSSVVNLDCDGRARNSLPVKLKTSQGVTRHVSLDGLFDRLGNFFDFVNLVNHGTAAKHERKSQQRGCG